HATVLHRVSLEVGVNESVGLVGESGSGKTTLARCVLGLENQSEGTIAIDGVVIKTFRDLDRAELRNMRQAVQIVFQDPYTSLNPMRTVESTLKEALAMRTPRPGDMKSEVKRLLSQVGIPGDYARRKPVALSGGERQRIAIARALAVRPKLMVCDEPVSS